VARSKLTSAGLDRVVGGVVTLRKSQLGAGDRGVGRG
jgi:hypothetical protein